MAVDAQAAAFTFRPTSLSDGVIVGVAVAWARTTGCASAFDASLLGAPGALASPMTGPRGAAVFVAAAWSCGGAEHAASRQAPTTQACQDFIAASSTLKALG